jgi:hypothetical protein
MGHEEKHCAGVGEFSFIGLELDRALEIDKVSRPTCKRRASAVFSPKVYGLLVKERFYGERGHHDP